jgi:energy-coupling factor transport system substrate-specific component
MDSARWIRIAIGTAVGALVGLGLYATGQVWPLAAAVGVIVADVVYAGLTLAQTGEWGSMRVAAGLVTFAVATYIGIIGFGDFGTQADVNPNTFTNAKAANAWALILTVAMVIGAVVTYGLELVQTGRLASLSGQFGTRTYLLMAVGIGVNVILGQTVASALKIPIYLDSIGTILVGVLCGPIAGALTGGLGNILWSYVIPPPFQYQPAAAFAIVAVAIGVIAGLLGRAGFMRPRPNRSSSELVAGGAVTLLLVGSLAWVASLAYTKIFQTQIDLFPDPAKTDLIFVLLGYLAIALVALAVVGLFALLLVRRDLTAAYVVVAGVFTGIVAALISAPIAAGVFGGVTASGTDFLVAAFRQAGADVYAATTGQGLISDPIDKVTTFFTVYLILSALANRFKARFPQGEHVLEEPSLEEPSA